MVFLEGAAFATLPRLVALAAVGAGDSLLWAFLVLVRACAYRAFRMLYAGCLGVAPLLAVEALCS